MALIGSISINMVVNTTKMVQSLKTAEGALRSFSAKAIAPVTAGMSLIGDAIGGVINFVSDLSRQLLLFGGIAAAVAATALWKIAEGASAFVEQASRAKVIFGQYAKLVIDEADRMAIAFGISRKAFIQAASAFGTIFEGAKYTEEDAAKLSVHFTRLATDLSSLVHIPVQEAMDKIQSGLAGQVRPLREVGVFMSEAEVETYAYAHGIAKLNAQLTESQKIQARIGFITDALAKAQGNLADTAGSAANQVRSLAGRFENLKDSIGTSLLQFLVPALEEVNTGIHAIQMAWEASGYAASQASVEALGGAGKQVQGIGLVQQALMWGVDAWQQFKIKAIETALAVGKAMLYVADQIRSTVYILGNLAAIAAVLGTANVEMSKLGVNIQNGFESGVHAIEDMRRGLLKLNEEQKAAPPASIAIAEAFAKARADIEKTRLELKNTPALDVNKLKPAAEAAKAAGVPKFASATAAYSAEANNAILRSRFGAGVTGNEPAKQTAVNTKVAAEESKKQTNVLLQIAGHLTGLPGGVFNAAVGGNF